jgi:hypothetical protein
MSTLVARPADPDARLNIIPAGFRKFDLQLCDLVPDER